MSIFNWIEIPEQCADCGTSIAREIQFKYGDVWSHKYQIGDELTWTQGSRTSVGYPGCAEVHLRGVAISCPSCGAEPRFGYYRVLLRQDKIIKIEPVEEDFEFRERHFHVVRS